MNFNFLPETNWVDLIVVIFLIRGCYIGLNLGFSVEFFKLLGALSATVASFLLYSKIGEWFTSRSFVPLQIAQTLSFLLLFFLLLFLFRIIRNLMFKILHLELFGELERWGGFVLGLVRSIIVASLFLFALTLLPADYIKQSVEERSLSGAYIKQVAPWVKDFIVQSKPKGEENQ